MQASSRLHIVVPKGHVILKLGPYVDQALLVWGGALLVLDGSLGFFNGSIDGQSQGDGLASQGLHVKVDTGAGVTAIPKVGCNVHGSHPFVPRLVSEDSVKWSIRVLDLAVYRGPEAKPFSLQVQVSSAQISTMHWMYSGDLSCWLCKSPIYFIPALTGSSCLYQRHLKAKNPNPTFPKEQHTP